MIKSERAHGEERSRRAFKANTFIYQPPPTFLNNPNQREAIKNKLIFYKHASPVNSSLNFFLPIVRKGFLKNWVFGVFFVYPLSNTTQKTKLFPISTLMHRKPAARRRKPAFHSTFHFAASEGTLIKNRTRKSWSRENRE